MTQAQIQLAQTLLAAEFDYCVTEAEEAVLDRLAAEGCPTGIDLAAVRETGRWLRAQLGR